MSLSTGLILRFLAFLWENWWKHLLPILILQTEMKGSYWTITGCHRFRLGGSQHLDTSSLSSARSRASGSVIICQRAGQSPRPPAAPYTLPILQYKQLNPNVKNHNVAEKRATAEVKGPQKHFTTARCGNCNIISSTYAHATYVAHLVYLSESILH